MEKMNKIVAKASHRWEDPWLLVCEMEEGGFVVGYDSDQDNPNYRTEEFGTIEEVIQNYDFFYFLD